MFCLVDTVKEIAHLSKRLRCNAYFDDLLKFQAVGKNVSVESKFS